ncbi:MAG: adenylosuccinate synthetase, partial [Nitrososphaera sp.]|nr:adenylosuccinate synthetase [Nitrososphaera sp.]
QGFGLSLLHSPYYPKVTSRDTTAASFVAEVGLSPLDVTEVILVIRAFPIRVAGDSGPLPNQTDWETVGREGGWASSIVEYTSVTRKVRRVARFDSAVVKEAIQTNAPTTVVLNHVDYVDATCVRTGCITHKIESFVRQVESQIGTSIAYVGLGPTSLLPRPGRNKLVRRRG